MNPDIKLDQMLEDYTGGILVCQDPELLVAAILRGMEVSSSLDSEPEGYGFGVSNGYGKGEGRGHGGGLSIGAGSEWTSIGGFGISIGGGNGDGTGGGFSDEEIRRVEKSLRLVYMGHMIIDRITTYES